MDSPTSASWQALGTTAVVVVNEPGELAGAVSAVRRVVADIDRACSRFRNDSELVELNAAGGSPTQVSPLFMRAAQLAIRAAQLTEGDLDPTIGSSLRVAGYDRDFAAIRAGGSVRFTRAAGYQCITIDEELSCIRLPLGVELDFGATAKALAADEAAAAASAHAHRGVLVGLGGDVATAGPSPSEGWSVRVTDDSAEDSNGSGQTVRLRDGGLATSSTTLRRWRRGSNELHHILDPATGAPVPEYWRTVSVAAANCVDANIASTTAIIRGAAAPAWLAQKRLPARLVAADGVVTFIAGWPEVS